MCLAIPMQVTQVEGFMARCAARGVERDVNLLLLQDEAVQIGDHVLIHIDYAIQKITAEEALSTWELLDQIAEEDVGA